MLRRRAMAWPVLRPASHTLSPRESPGSASISADRSFCRACREQSLLNVHHKVGSAEQASVAMHNFQTVHCCKLIR